MNENYNNIYDEAEIDLINMMFYLLRQWRVLLIALIIGVMAGMGIYLVKNINSRTSTIIEDRIDYTNYEVEPDAHSNMELAYKYRLLYDKQVEYNQNSLIMNMDPNHVYYGELKYYLSAGTDTRLFLELYNGILNNAELLNEIKNAGQLDCDVQYVREIVDCITRRESGGPESTDTDGNMQKNTILADDNTVIYYIVYYSDQDACEAMLQVIQEEVEKRSQEYQSQYGDHMIHLLNSDVCAAVNTDYLNLQKDGADAVNVYLTNILKFESALKEGDLYYYKSVYLNQENDDKTDYADDGKTSYFFSKELAKWIAGGTLLACICWGMYYCVKYSLDKHLKTAGELRDVYGLRILGRISKPYEGKGGLDRKLAELEGRSGGPADTLLYVKSMILSLDKKNILIGGTYESEVSKELQSMCADHSGFHWTGFVHQDDGALQMAKKTDGEIIVAEVGKTLLYEIKRELNVCMIQNIPVLGVIVIE